MIIAFCGHSHISELNLEEKVFQEIEKIAQGESVTFYIGGYGQFSEIARIASLRYKKNHKNSVVTYVTPYIDEAYLKIRRPYLETFDNVIYPDIEKTPRRFAILERNKFMMKKADYVIGYVISSGGAAKALNYAIKHNIKVINLAEN